MLAEACRPRWRPNIAVHAAERDENGRRLVVRNGSHQSRAVLTSAGGRHEPGGQSDGGTELPGGGRIG